MDIKLIGKGFKRDIGIKNGDLEFDASLRSSVILSLIINARANEDEVSPDQNPQGWWASPVGSKLWLMERSKITSASLARVETYCRQALQNLIDDGAVARFDVSAFRCSGDGIGVNIVAYRNDLSQERFVFSNLWEEIRTALHPVPSLPPSPVTGGSFLTTEGLDLLTTESGDRLEWR